MTAKTLRTFVRALRGRSLKAVPGAKPGAFPWHVAEAEPHFGGKAVGLGAKPAAVSIQETSIGRSGKTPGFNLRKLPSRTPETLHHTFRIVGPTQGRVITEYSPSEKHLRVLNVFSLDRQKPLDLGVGGYHRLFKGIKSALGLKKGAEVKFDRIYNIHRRQGPRRFPNARTSRIRL